MDRCLLYIENGNVMMHQLIKEMGHEIVRQQSRKDPGKRSRLWRHEDSFNVLKDNEGTRKVEGLILDMRMIKEADNARKRSYGDFLHNTNKHISIENLKIGAIEKMKNLMLLQLDYVTFSRSYKKLPKKLRWHRWHGFSLKSIPCDVPLEKLVVLDMRYSKLKTVIGSLKVLNLGYSLELAKTPDFRGLPSLESLILEGCISLTQVCESIGYLEKLALLDISDCIRLKDIKCFPMSLVSLKMSNCPNLGVLGQVQCLDTSSLPSLLVNIDVSKCNLFDSSFPNDWSHLLALKFLNISRNNISSLPNCIKSLPSLEILECTNCSQLQSVLGVPKSVKELYATENMSLEKVQTAPNLLTDFYTGQSAKLRVVEGCFKHELIQKVEKKILRYLGFESISEVMKLGLDDKQMVSTEKVIYEFGIFSTYFLGKTLPCFKYRENGSKISFRVPSHPEGARISGLNVSYVYTSTVYFESSIISSVEVNNKTKLVVWKYTPTKHVKCENMREPYYYVWSSLWRCGDLLDDGDEVVVCITLSGGDRVKECGINLVYEDDEDLEDKDEMDDEEKKDAHCMFNKISWTDRLLVEISDYVHRGKTYCFKVGGFNDVPDIGGISGRTGGAEEFHFNLVLQMHPAFQVRFEGFKVLRVGTFTSG
ncbi:TMV resistance protein N-like protein isoform X3 [Tanacetum coccineum]